MILVSVSRKSGIARSSASASLDHRSQYMDGPPAIPNDKQVEVLHLFRCFTHTQERVVWKSCVGCRDGKERTGAHNRKTRTHTKIDFQRHSSKASFMVLFFHAIDPWWDLFSCLPMAGEKKHGRRAKLPYPRPQLLPNVGAS